MNEDKNNLYNKGNPNPNRMGFITLTSLTHPYGSFDEKMDALCKILKRNRSFIDSDDFEVEMIAAADNGNHVWAWMESKAKETNGIVDISFTEYLFKGDKIVHSWEIVSYNPYFGCQVSYMEWWEDSIVTIYREKHDTYISSINLNGENSFLKIEDKWCMSGNRVFFRGYKESEVKVVKVPNLEIQSSLTLEQAKREEGLPEFMYTLK